MRKRQAACSCASFRSPAPRTTCRLEKPPESSWPGDARTEVDRVAFQKGCQDAHLVDRACRHLEKIAIEDDEIGGLAGLDRSVRRVLARGPRAVDREGSKHSRERRAFPRLNRRPAAVERLARHRELDGIQRVHRRRRPIAARDDPDAGRRDAGQRIKVYLKDVERGQRGPQLIVSRGNKEFIEWLFRAEVPEMESGAVEIKAIAREAGVRTKLAVNSTVQGVDPVGTFVGGHGTRVNAVMSEVGEQEKIDIVVWDDDTKQFITNALSPTKVNKVELDEKNNKAKVVVPEDQLSIAIGKSGQNVRLASKLTGYEIDIESDKKVTISEQPKEKTEKTQKESRPKKLKKKSELESSLLEAIEEHGTEE